MHNGVELNFADLIKFKTHDIINHDDTSLNH